MWAGDERFQQVRGWRAVLHIGDIHDGVPIAAELADLLGSDFEQQVSTIAIAGSSGANVVHIERTAGNGGQDAHQRALRIAIVDVKCVHVSSPNLSRSDSRPRLSSGPRPESVPVSNLSSFARPD